MDFPKGPGKLSLIMRCPYIKQASIERGSIVIIIQKRRSHDIVLFHFISN